MLNYTAQVNKLHSVHVILDIKAQTSTVVSGLNYWTEWRRSEVKSDYCGSGFTKMKFIQSFFEKKALLLKAKHAAMQIYDI